MHNTINQDTSDHCQRRLNELLTYVSHLAKRGVKPVFSTQHYKQLHYAEHELKGHAGIVFDVESDDGQTVWLEVQRLKRFSPPSLPEACLPWVTVNNDPLTVPVVHERRSAILDAVEVEELLAEGQLSLAHISKPEDADDQAQGLSHVTLLLENFPALKVDVERYIEKQWQAWSKAEAPRRETIAIYDALFSLRQLFDAQGEEQDLELVWGVGLSRWECSNPDVDTKSRIDYPLIEKLVEIDIDQQTGTLRIRPRQVELEFACTPYIALKVAGVDSWLNFAKQHISSLPEELIFSPFVAESYEAILRQAANLFSESGCYWPDINPNRDDRQAPDSDSTLKVTDSWVLYARPRSQTSFIADVERFSDDLKAKGDTVVSSPAKRLVSELSNKRPSLISKAANAFLTQQQTAHASNVNLKDDTEFFFPKPFNDAQLKIIQRLKYTDGLVVQGPPGTGKTHTIANIICHYLATGRSVLVTSKGDAALSVVREQIPEAIRDLSISLLSSDNDGLKQLEGAVSLLASIVDSHDATRLKRDIKSLEVHVQQLRKDIKLLDQELQAWGEKQLEPIAPYLLAESTLPQSALSPSEPVTLTAMDLAQKVIAEQSQHQWFPDSLGIEPDFEPNFSEHDIKELAAARHSLGQQLIYLDVKLPSLQQLPTLDTLGSVHHALVEHKRLFIDDRQQNLPLLKSTEQSVLDQAESILPALQPYLDFLTRLAETPWLRDYYHHVLSPEDTAQHFRLLDDLVPELNELADLREPFISQPVVCPQAHSRDSLDQALRKLAAGQKAFGFMEFGKKETKLLLEQIQVSGDSPSTVDQWQHVIHYLSFQDKAKRFAVRWNSVADELGIPIITSAYAKNYREFGSYKLLLQECQEKALKVWPSLLATMDTVFLKLGVAPSLALDALTLHNAQQRIHLALKQQELLKQRVVLDDALKRLQTGTSPICDQMSRLLSDKVGHIDSHFDSVASAWAQYLQELQGLHDQQALFDTVTRVTQDIEQAGAKKWAQALRCVPTENESHLTPEHWLASWRWQQQRAYLRSIDGRKQVQALTAKRERLDQDLKQVYSDLVQKKTYLGLFSNMSERVQGALQRFVSAVSKLGKGTGKRAARHRREALNAMQACYEGVPCWIMPTWRVSEVLPSEFGSFDLVIIDEASQSDISALPAMLRARKLLVVGDDKQVSPGTGFISENEILQLQHNFLRDQPFKELLLPGSSLYDLASSLFPGQRVMLTEHFRCVEAIIKFSEQFYSEPLVPLRLPKQSERLDPPLIDIFVPQGIRNKKDLNLQEMDAIVREIKHICANPDMKGRSIGVISLIGSKQAQAIQERLLVELGEDLYQSFHIACGDSATFQGKERDIMFLSLVVGAGQGTPLTKREYEQRFNVALSRARDRMYLVRSVQTKDLGKENDLRLKVLRHFENPLQVEHLTHIEPSQVCESKLEREVYEHLLNKGYRVIPKVKIGAYTIDLVVEGEHDRRLAIELDGDRYYPPEQWAEDLSQQRTMERVGWFFWRCWGASYLIDPEHCLKDLENVLQGMGIQPLGDHTLASERCVEYREFLLKA